MIKYICMFRLVLRCLLDARKENLTGVSTGLTGWSKNLDPTGNSTCLRPDRFPSLSDTAFKIGLANFIRIEFILAGTQFCKTPPSRHCFCPIDFNFPCFFSTLQTVF